MYRFSILKQKVMKQTILLLCLALIIMLLPSCVNKGEDDIIVDPEPIIQLPYDEIGALSGHFSVSPTETIRFSRGLLQYNNDLKEWRFGNTQYEMCHIENNHKDVENKTGWFDTFGWATSGYKYAPTLLSRRYEDFYSGMNGIVCTEYDWGYYNKISNGGNRTKIWRTITQQEWDYIINRRPNSYNKLGFGYINGYHGVILLPDDWIAPDNCPFMQFVEFKNRRLQFVSEAIEYSRREWEEMELAGAVFMPQPFVVHYWSSSSGRDRSVAWSLYVSNSLALGQQSIKTEYSTGRYVQCFVRLITDY